jgi:hypothetical protein
MQRVDRAGPQDCREAGMRLTQPRNHSRSGRKPTTIADGSHRDPNRISSGSVYQHQHGNQRKTLVKKQLLIFQLMRKMPPIP